MKRRMVRGTGFEPMTPSTSRKCSTSELAARDQLVDRVGFEPTTH